MINTFYHVGQKQFCEYQACFSPIDQKPIPARNSSDEDEDQEMSATGNVITEKFQTKQEERRSLTIASFNRVGDVAIQIIKQSTEKGQRNKDPRVVMEITTLEHPYLTLEDIVVNRDTILNLEKRIKSTKNAFPLFNH